MKHVGNCRALLPRLQYLYRDVGARGAWLIVEGAYLSRIFIQMSRNELSSRAARVHLRGRKFRILKIFDIYAKECLASFFARRIRSQDVILVLADLFIEHGAPERPVFNERALAGEANRCAQLANILPFRVSLRLRPQRRNMHLTVRRNRRIALVGYSMLCSLFPTISLRFFNSFFQRHFAFALKQKGKEVTCI